MNSCVETTCTPAARMSCSRVRVRVRVRVRARARVRVRFRARVRTVLRPAAGVGPP